jgi:PIN domain nuclease of toxin-antitoxin system
MMLFQNGSIEMAADPHPWVRRALSHGFVAEAPLMHEIALHSRLIDLHHKDRADRFIAATALVKAYTLATSDKRLLGFPGIPTPPTESRII